MPEGDTIHRAATRLKAVLDGQTIQRAESRWLGATAASLVGRQIRDVRALGKHLLIMLADDRVLHSHMGMTGSWHIYRLGESWQKPAYRAAVWLECQDVCVVCFSPKVLELLSAAAFRRHEYLNRLGPDLLGTPPSEPTTEVLGGTSELPSNANSAFEEVLARFRQGNKMSIGEAVLNQTIVSGIGNVYKSELLFQLGLHPRTLVSKLRDDQILELTAKASELMAKNLTGRPRTTRFALDGGRFFVYGRSGKPCYSCGTRIALIRQGDAGRTTYFCPRCQPVS